MSECPACGDRYKESCAECVMRALRRERDQALRELGEARAVLDGWRSRCAELEALLS